MDAGQRDPLFVLSGSGFLADDGPQQQQQQQHPPPAMADSSSVADDAANRLFTGSSTDVVTDMMTVVACNAPLANSTSDNDLLCLAGSLSSSIDYSQPNDSSSPFADSTSASFFCSNNNNNPTKYPEFNSSWLQPSQAASSSLSPGSSSTTGLSCGSSSSTSTSSGSASSTNTGNRVCEICGVIQPRRTSNFLGNYLICEACKKFLDRCQQRKGKSLKLRCKNGGRHGAKCDLAMTRSCPKCRLDKCRQLMELLKPSPSSARSFPTATPLKSTDCASSTFVSGGADGAYGDCDFDEASSTILGTGGFADNASVASETTLATTKRGGHLSKSEKNSELALFLKECMKTDAIEMVKKLQTKVQLLRRLEKRGDWDEQQQQQQQTAVISHAATATAASMALFSPMLGPETSQQSPMTAALASFLAPTNNPLVCSSPVLYDNVQNEALLRQLMTPGEAVTAKTYRCDASYLVERGIPVEESEFWKLVSWCIQDIVVSNLPFSKSLAESLRDIPHIDMCRLIENSYALMFYAQTSLPTRLDVVTSFTRLFSKMRHAWKEIDALMEHTREIVTAIRAWQPSQTEFAFLLAMIFCNAVPREKLSPATLSQLDHMSRLVERACKAHLRQAHGPKVAPLRLQQLEHIIRAVLKQRDARRYALSCFYKHHPELAYSTVHPVVEVVCRQFRETWQEDYCQVRMAEFPPPPNTAIKRGVDELTDVIMENI